jgi:hypothetical protein
MLLLAELTGMELGETADDGLAVSCGSAASQLSISATCVSTFDGIRIRLL